MTPTTPTTESADKHGRGGIEWLAQPTARDVAALAGVSAQTVSRVANGATNVRPETRERVVAAMTRIGYAPNAAARTLRSGRSDVLGVVVHHLTRTGEARIVEAVATTAHARGYAVTLVDASSESLADVNDAVGRLGRGVAGLVVLGLETADVDRLQVPARLPVVVADSRALPLPTVGFDQAGGTHLAVAHLLGLGHRTVHMLAGPEASVQSRQREQAWRSLLQAGGHPVPALLRGDWTPASGYVAGQRIARDPEVSAVFAANDEMAAGLLRALHEAGRCVPEEVSVVGLDDVIAEYLWPPLTSVHQDFTAMGENLVRLLLGRLDEKPQQDIPTLVPARLVVRASSGPPPSTTPVAGTPRGS